MKKKYNFIVGLVLVFLLGSSVVFGQSVNYLDFNGSSDYVKYTDDATLGRMDGATDYTIEAWIYPIDGRVVEYDRILQRYYSIEIQMYDQNNDGDVEDWYLNIMDGSGDNYFNTEGDATLTLDAWNHIAVINNSSNSTLKLYVNGVDVTASGGYSNKDLRPSQVNDNLYIGSKNTTSNEFGGYIDEVRLKNVAENISNLQSKITDSEYSSDANTAGLFHFDEGGGSNTLNEASGTNAIINSGTKWTSWRFLAGQSLPLDNRFMWNAGTNDWGTASNWDPGTLPTATDNVIIRTGITSPHVAVGTAAVADEVTIEGSASLFIDNDGTTAASLVASDIDVGWSSVLDISGNVTVSGTLDNSSSLDVAIVLNSTTTYQGSLIHSSANINATVKRQITQYSGDGDGWHLLSSPVDNFAIATSDFLPTIDDDDLFYWDEDNTVAGTWVNYRDGGFTNFTNGQGYLCAYKSTATKNFTGELNVANATRGSLTNTGDGTNDGWQLVGNPFSSAIDWSAGTWTKTGLGANAKVYKEDGGNWFTKTIIPSTQGFFVEVTADPGTLVIPADARVHDAQDWYKQAKESANTLELKLSGGDNTYYDITQVIITENATMEFDAEFDGHKFFGAATAPQLYTLSESNELLTDNHIPNLANEILIPMNFRVPSEGEYTINVEINTVEREGDIYLEDLKTGVFTNLTTTNSYTFQASEDDASERFMLHFNSATGIGDVEESSSVNIYANAHSIYLNSTEAVTGTIMIYDMGGKLILSEQLQNSNMHIISAETLSGVYLVRFIGAERVSTQKVIIQ